jgi:DNA replication protein DnaC
MNCSKCNNTGWIIYTDKDGYETAKQCDCVKVKQSLARLERSGLGGLLDKYTFDRYIAKYDFQKDLLTKAKNYLNEKDKWFVVLGQSGSGKSMICTAICGELLKQGHEVRFMSWLTESVRLKQNVNNADVYEPLMEDYKNCEVLYIDDFLKNENITSADLRIANEIINFRCVANKRTLISSERLVGNLCDIDEAVIGRIVEMAEEYLTEIVGKEKNYRLRHYL